MIRWLEIAERRQRVVWTAIALLAALAIYFGMTGFRDYYRARAAIAQPAEVTVPSGVGPATPGPAGVARRPSADAPDADERAVPGATSLFYLTVQLFVLESGALVDAVEVDGADVHLPVPWRLEVARYLAPVVAATATLGALVALLGRGVTGVRLWRLRDHVVVCGLDGKGAAVVAHLLDLGESVVAIDRREIVGTIETMLAERGGVLLAGDATDPAILRRARVHRAEALVAVCGEDGTNVEVALQAREVVAAFGGRPPRFLVHALDTNLCRALSTATFGTAAAIRWEFFDAYDQGARAVLGQFFIFDPATVARGMAPSLAVVGPGLLGDRIVLEAARQWSARFAWLREAEGAEEQLSIAIVDLDAAARVERLCRPGAGLAEGTVLRAVPLDVADLTAEAAERVLALATTVYVCCESDTAAVTVGLDLWKQRTAPVAPSPDGATDHEYTASAAATPTAAHADASRSSGPANVLPLARATAHHPADPCRLPLSRVRERGSGGEGRPPGSGGEGRPPGSGGEGRPPGSGGEGHPPMPPRARIVVCLSRRIALADFLSNLDTASADEGSLEVFALLESICNADLFPSSAHERLARATHERWRRERLREGLTAAANPFLVPFEQLPDAVRESNRRQVIHGLRHKLELLGWTARPVGGVARRLDGLRTVLAVRVPALAGLLGRSRPPFVFPHDVLERLSRLEHDRWNDERLLLGWRRCRPDEPNARERRLSPHLAPWSDLDDTIKEYDRQAVRALPDLLRTAGLEIVRPGARG